MRFPYAEGVATHSDPESCGCPRKGACEALTGERAGLVLSPEKLRSRVPTLWTEAEGNTGRRASASVVSGPAWSETQCMYGDSMRGNREVPLSPIPMAGWAARGRHEP